MRLDHFLPTLTKAKRRSVRPDRWISRASRRIFPASWMSDSETRKSGVARRALKRVGATWLSSPVRRVIQSVCFILFLWLFFYCCWPYRAQPAPTWKGWTPAEIDAESGRVRVVSDNSLRGAISAGTSVYVFDESQSGQKPIYLGVFVSDNNSNFPASQSAEQQKERKTKSEIQNVSSNTSENAKRSAIKRPVVELRLHPQKGMSAEALEKLSVSTGPWTISMQPPNRWPSHFADEFRKQDQIPVESFLLIDPLVGLSTALAAKSWMVSLWAVGIILAVCVFIPRGFCGYLCPLGTLIDLCDWAVTGRVKRFRLPDNGWWVHLKYYFLFGILVAGFCGVLLSRFFSAIPILTRGLLFMLAPLQLGFMRGWHQVPPMNLGQAISIVLFLGVLGLGFFRSRFWCKYVCPSGAVFSLGNLFRVSERKVEDTCIHCNKCVEICPFDAIKPDFTTRVTDCTLCQTCGGVCPTHAIKFVERSNRFALKLENDPPTHEHSFGNSLAKVASFLGLRRFPPLHPFRRIAKLNLFNAPLDSMIAKPIARRSFVASSVGMMAGFAGGIGFAAATKTMGARLDNSARSQPVRPPGSVPEKEFLELCIRCGECFKVCPNSVLQPLGFQQGLEGLWTPHVAADWAGCEPSCNACGQACPTGAIRPLPLEEKKAARMGLAVVNEKTCLPWTGNEACQLCVDECAAAGYDAIEFIRVHSAPDESGKSLAGLGFLAPKVDPLKCVGCGLCQMRCFSINAKTKHSLKESAIIVRSGAGKEDRMMKGSYVALHSERNGSTKTTDSNANRPVPERYLPEFLEPPKR